MIPGVQEFLDVVLKNILRESIVFPHVRPSHRAWNLMMHDA
jgi:hypothetical protein